MDPPGNIVGMLFGAVSLACSGPGAARNNAKVKRVRIRQFCSRVKMFKGCAICGYKKHPAALHFNHIDPTKKVGNVSKLKSWAKVKEEIRKCEVLCANCHAIKTVEEKHHLNEGNA